MEPGARRCRHGIGPGQPQCQHDPGLTVCVARVDESVVNNGRVARQQIGGADPAILIARLQHKLVGVVHLVRGQGERRGQRERDVRAPELPVLGGPNRRQRCSWPFWRTAGCPGQQDVELPRRQAMRILQLGRSELLYIIWRHVSRDDLRPNRLGPRHRIPIGHQRHRRDAPWHMTLPAPLAHDRVHVFRIRVLRCHQLVRFVAPGREKEDGDDCNEQDDSAACAHRWPLVLRRENADCTSVAARENAAYACSICALSPISP